MKRREIQSHSTLMLYTLLLSMQAHADNAQRESLSISLTNTHIQLTSFRKPSLPLPYTHIHGQVDTNKSKHYHVHSQHFH